MQSTPFDWTRFFSKYLKPRIVFLILALTAGLAMVFVNAPFQAPDEGAHFWRAYHVYQGDLIASREGAAVGGQIPESVAYARQPYQYLISHPEERVDMDIFTEDLSKPFDAEKKVFIDFFTPALFTPIVYTPQVLGIAIGRLCGLSALKIMYAGRLSSLLCWIAMVYWAIRITPVFRWVFVLVALLPRNLFQAASLSADGPTNAIALLLTALILHSMFSKEPSLRKWVLWTILLLSVLLSMAKQVYLPLVGLVFLVPVEKFNGWRSKLIFCGCVIAAAVLATGMWSMMIRGFYTPWKEANAPEQMALILARPWVFPIIAVNSFLKCWGSLVFSFIGVLGFLDVFLPKWIYYTYPFLLIAAAMFDGSCKEPVNGLKRSWILLVCIAVFFLIELSMYLVWTKPGASLVEGVHGRYFIPLVIPALLATVYNRRLKGLEIPLIPLTMSLYLFGVLSAACWAVYARYYGPVL
ncbi:MAG: DUF2142 domain-containing protein [Planctomycetota bacterium]|jgi:uncharacterized membrane protein